MILPEVLDTTTDELIQEISRKIALLRIQIEETKSSEHYTSIVKLHDSLDEISKILQEKY